jgi:uncharacterized membrane protein
MTANRLALFVLLGLSVAGIVVAGYLTSVHYASVPLACSSSGVVNCEQVLSSRYSEVIGVPWSVGGIAWFSVSGLLALLALAKTPEPEPLQPAQLAWSLLGLGVILYLIGVELVAVKHICLWCTSMHVLIGITLLVVLFRRPDLAEEEEVPEAVQSR